MNPLPLTAELLFGRIRPESVWDIQQTQALLCPKERQADYAVPPAFLEAAHAHDTLRYHGEEEKQGLFRLAAIKGGEPLKHGSALGHRADMWNLLIHVCHAHLVPGDGQPLIRYEKLLSWRMLTSATGQDLLVCAYLAHEDLHHARETQGFAWRPHLQHDNVELRQRLQAGLAENHYHLYGSLPSFHLLWMRLMRRLSGHGTILDAPRKVRLAPSEASISKEIDLHVLSEHASLIRLYLFLHLEGAFARHEAQQQLAKEQAAREKAQRKEPENEEEQHKDKHRDDLELLQEVCQRMVQDAPPSSHMERLRLQSLLDATVHVHGYHLPDSIAPDYALDAPASARDLQEAFPLSGERRLLYRCCRAIYGGVRDPHFEHLFYLYLLIKARVRRESLQLNSRVGFTNFKQYQDRKTDFAEDSPKGSKEADFWNTWTYRLGIQLPLTTQRIDSLELRVPPQKSALAWAEEIKKIADVCEKPIRALLSVHHAEVARIERQEKLYEQERKIQEGREAPPKSDLPPYFFVAHFAKRAEDFRHPSIRHHSLRETVRRQALAIHQFREGHRVRAQQLRGIDAASAEIGCRPEVFATAFRYLRRSNPPAPHVPLHERAAVLPSLRVTYHVGEDFLDLVDGLRAIDEAIRFLGYQRGDRLGHALALGVDAAEWYVRKNKVVVLRRQDLLDNLAWMHGQLRQLGSVTFQPLLSQLEKDWTIHFRKLSEAAFPDDKTEPCTIHNYYEAWRLRGDDPILYDYAKEERGVLRSQYGSEWALCLTRHDPREGDLESLRCSDELVRLYQTYHRQSWREAGNQTVDYEISLPYMQAVGVLQERLQHDILQRGICIEANPTSNYLIGTFRRYDAHPITRLFNLGLTYDPADLAACPQLNVSINTDDLGIFDTSLENEYALMATALQKMKTPDGQPRFKHALIMDWLDRVRLNGLSQSFLLREGGQTG